MSAFDDFLMDCVNDCIEGDLTEPHCEWHAIGVSWLWDEVTETYLCRRCLEDDRALYEAGL